MSSIVNIIKLNFTPIKLIKSFYKYKIKIGIFPLWKKSKNILRFNLYTLKLIHMIYKIIVKEKKNIMIFINVSSKILKEMGMKNIFLNMELICYAAILINLS